MSFVKHNQNIQMYDFKENFIKCFYIRFEFLVFSYLVSVLLSVIKSKLILFCFHRMMFQRRSRSTFNYRKIIYILIAFLSIVLFSNNVDITFTTKLTNYNIHLGKSERWEEQTKNIVLLYTIHVYVFKLYRRE